MTKAQRTSSRIVRPFRNLFLGAAVLALFPLMVLLTFGAMMIAVAGACLFLCPAGGFLIVLASVAGVVWALLMVPSLVFCGDFSWPCAAARVILGPADHLADRVNDSDLVDNAFDWPMDLMDDAWSAYGRLARQVEGCDD